MNQKPIQDASDPDLRTSIAALRRAAQRARELAARTGTSIVVSEAGVIRNVTPVIAATAVHEPVAPYKEEK
jgi:hypothetical protein